MQFTSSTLTEIVRILERGSQSNDRCHKFADVLCL